jgi:hypothetical protein
MEIPWLYPTFTKSIPQSEIRETCKILNLSLKASALKYWKLILQMLVIINLRMSRK